MSYKGETLATQLRHARESAGLSQRALSSASGLGQSHISLIERGALEPGLGSLIDMARALDLELVLVPRKLLPAVEAITGNSPLHDTQSSSKGITLTEIARSERLFKRLRTSQGSSADLDKIQEMLRLLHYMPLSGQNMATIFEIIDPLYRLEPGKESRDIIKHTAERLQALRNQIVHNVQSDPRPAYSLDEDEDA